MRAAALLALLQSASWASQPHPSAATDPPLPAPTPAPADPTAGLRDDSMMARGPPAPTPAEDPTARRQNRMMAPPRQVRYLSFVSHANHGPSSRQPGCQRDRRLWLGRSTATRRRSSAAS